jgi:AraC family transcriptional regulator
LTTDLGVAEICFEVGYSSVVTFTTRFTQLVGVPPGRMRRLSEELYAVFEDPGEPVFPPAPPGTGIRFRILGSDLEGAWIFVGLFLGPIPQGRPVAGALLTGPGVYLLSPRSRRTLLSHGRHPATLRGSSGVSAAQ